VQVALLVVLVVEIGVMVCMIVWAVYWEGMDGMMGVLRLE
jgi:hypothetical protein